MARRRTGGGPPCQRFSRAGRSKIRSLVQEGIRQKVDHGRELWQSFLQIVSCVQPRAVLMENVPDMTLGDDLVTVRHMAERLEPLERDPVPIQDPTRVRRDTGVGEYPAVCEDDADRADVRRLRGEQDAPEADATCLVEREAKQFTTGARRRSEGRTSYPMLPPSRRSTGISSWRMRLLATIRSPSRSQNQLIRTRFSGRSSPASNISTRARKASGSFPGKTKEDSPASANSRAYSARSLEFSRVTRQRRRLDGMTLTAQRLGAQL